MRWLRNHVKRQRGVLDGIVVILSNVALVALIYGRTLRPGFVSDAWVYLARLRTGLGQIGRAHV